MSEKKFVKQYSNGEVTVVWQPSMCIHAEVCLHGLPDVFNPKQSPWIKVDAGDTRTIVEQVKKCPSGALSFFLNDEEKEEKKDASTPILTPIVVQVNPNGPLILKETCLVKMSDGSETLKENMAAFCRCGASANKPFCDGSHKKIGFEE